MSHGVWPVDFKDSSQAAVDEGLCFFDGGLLCAPWLCSMQQDGLYTGAEQPDIYSCEMIFL